MQETQQTPGNASASTAITPTVNRTYKSRIFEMIFSDKKELLQLYNAMNGTNYDNPELLEINTLENAIYMSMHNDISFVIASQLYLYEHQSTYSPNLPLRCLLYISDLYSALTMDANFYGTKLIKIPTPEFVVFYNGTDEIADRQTIKLSDAFMVEKEDYSLELTATVLNINPGHSSAVLDACKTLKDYSEYSARVRRYAKTMDLEAAVELAITECIREGILAEFLRKNRAEAKSVSIYEYNEEKHMKFVREEGREEGLAAGRKEGFAARDELILRMKQSGLPLEEISKISGMSVEEINALSADTN